MVDPMTDNPIDRRHTNPTGTRGSGFWQRFGIPFAWFLAIYSWANPIYFIIVEWLTFGYYDSVVCDMARSLAIGLMVFGLLVLTPVGIVWFILMLVAVLRGQVLLSTFVTTLSIAVSPFVLTFLLLIVS